MICDVNDIWSLEKSEYKGKSAYTSIFVCLCFFFCLVTKATYLNIASEVWTRVCGFS